MSRLGVDHMLILHQELEAARQAAARLGFRPTPVSTHSPHMGTANTTIMLPDRQTYIEYLGIVAPTDHNAQMRSALDENGNHVFGLAMRGNAQEAYESLEAQGLANGKVIDFSREVDLAEGSGTASFSIVQLETGALPGLYGLVCEHHTPDVIWRDDCIEHPNGVRALSAIHGICPDPTAIADDWRRVFGSDSITVSKEALEVRTSTAKVRYLTPDAWSREYGTVPEVPGPRICVLEFSVHSTDVVSACLENGGVDYERYGSSVHVQDTIGLGARHIFTEVA